ncbi:MAG: hypothetical protein ABI480_06460 [Chitinophagaceae bacterium]
MKKLLLGVSLVTLFTAVILVSCKKNNDDKKDTTNYDTEASMQSDDQNDFSAQIESVADDVNVELESSASLNGRLDGLADLCHATVTADSASAIRTLTITYSGADCFNTYNRTGVVTVSIPAGLHWKDAGTAITVTYTNLVITRIADNKSFTINGSHVITNVNGGLLINVVSHPVTHTITSPGMTVTFSAGGQRTWQVARQRVFSYNNGLVISITGTHTDGAVNHIAEWGTNRFGRPFTSVIREPLVIRQDCNFRLTSGQIIHTVPVFTATATFGLNSSGAATTCPGAGHYYVKIDWVGQNNSHSVILPY